MGIDPLKNYYLSEASRLSGRCRKTISSWIKSFPDLFPSSKDPVNGRIRIAGEILIKIRDNKY